MCNRRQFARCWLLFFSCSRQFSQWSTWVVQNKVEANFPVSVQKQTKKKTKTLSNAVCFKMANAYFEFQVLKSILQITLNEGWRKLRGQKSQSSHVTLTQRLWRNQHMWSSATSNELACRPTTSTSWLHSGGHFNHYQGVWRECSKTLNLRQTIGKPQIIN